MAAPSTALSESAWAASAAEARFRINAPIAPARAALVIALDERAAIVTRRVAGLPWANAAFYMCRPGREPVRTGTRADEVLLHRIDGSPAVLGEELSGVDVTVVVATEDGGRDFAAAIGRACGERAITTAGVVLGDGFEADDAVAALRPYARVLLLSADESDLAELLRALRV